MNTRYNKNRIVLEGWMNVLKNMFISSNCHVVTLDNNRIVALSDDDKIDSGQIKPDSQKIFLISNASQSPMSEEIMVGTLPSAIEGDNEDDDFEMQQPTCSYASEILTNNSNDFSHAGKRTKATTCFATIRQKMIFGLLSNVNDEDDYIRKLTHFIDVEEAYARGMDIDTLNYDYEQLNLDTLPHFVGCSVRKLNMRTNKLQILLRCRKENETYKVYFDQFVEMEEKLLENGC